MEKISLSEKDRHAFSNTIISWQAKAGRHDLPWQTKTTSYRVWVSEIMLQQTQVATVIPYFKQFLRTYPSLASLAKAPQASVLHLWTGLGYYARARNLHRSAQIIANDHRGRFPKTLDTIIRLPGIGRSTAGAIMSIGMGLRGAILDGNVKRVLCRYFGLFGWPGKTKHQQTLWDLSEQLTPSTKHANYNQGMMDLGATCCTRSKPNCTACPLKTQCFANQNNQTQTLPSAKPKTQKPSKEGFFLVLRNRKGKVLLTQRPQEGLWGGLWSLPDFETKDQLIRFCQAHIAQEKIDFKPAPSIQHAFTHFTLKAHPVFIQGVLNKSTEQLQTREKLGNLLWYDTAAPQKIGTSALIQKIITQSDSDFEHRAQIK